ncbi:MAG TPA: hypothetical protein VIA18_18525 [Polyangia bacterium]|jgi:hypothetical protein|nr:hypothetical protein [Polyangia bacterium]
MRFAALACALALTVSSMVFADEPPDASSVGAAPVAPGPPSLTDAALAARVDALARELAETRAEVAALRREADAAASASGSVFRLGGARAQLFGFIQADAVAYDQASSDQLNETTGAPLNQTRFLIRRARLRVDVDYGWVAGALEFDGNTINGPVARIIDVEVSACWPRCGLASQPLVMATIGLMRIPFGFEVQQKDYTRLFLERSNVMRALFPGEFDLGARLQGGWRWLRWQVAAMNGHPSGDTQFALVSPTQSKDFLGRVGADTELHPRVRIVSGFSALWGTGYHSGTPDTKDQLVWRDSNGDGQVDTTELIGIDGQPGLPSRTFTRYAVAGDLRVVGQLPRLGQLEVYGEIVWATNLDRALMPADPIAAGRPLRELGWYVAATQELGRFASVGLRYDRYDPDADARATVGASIVPRDQTFATLAAIAAVEWRPRARLSLEYDRNTNALGVTASGAPATLGSDVVTIRGQVVF